MKLLGGPWELTVNPERGGRVTSLLLDGHELLDQGIGVDDPSREGFVDAGAFGWDEMVPTVDASSYPVPSPFAGLSLPDHGEAWRVPWTVLDETPSSTTMECVGLELPWRLARRIELTAHAVRAVYSYRNSGTHPLYAFWCSHVLFRYEAGMAVEGIDGFTAPLPGASKKMHLAPGSLSRARLAWTGGPALEVAWDASVTPYIGVWVCDGDLGGYRQIAIEPATGGNDHPDPAAPPPLLKPGDELRWWLEIRDARQS